MKTDKNISIPQKISSNDVVRDQRKIVFEIVKDSVKEMPNSSSMNEVKNNFASKDLESLNERNRTYKTFLESYIISFQNRSSNQQSMKKTFLIWTMILLSAIVIASFACIFVICRKPQIGFTDLAAAISSIVGVIVAFIELPKLVARNLFPSTEDDRTKELFSEMFNSDMQIRKLYSMGEIQKNEESNEDDSIKAPAENSSVLGE